MIEYQLMIRHSFHRLFRRSIRKTSMLLTVLSLFVFLLGGCAASHRQIACTIYPVGWLIQRIGGDHYEAVSVQKSGTLLQDASISDDFRDVLKRSRIFFHLGDCEPYIEAYEQDIRETGVRQSDLSVLNAVYDFARYIRREENGAYVWDETPYYADDESIWTDQGKKDLYIWMDPVSMLAMGRTIRDFMMQDDPSNSSFYDDNYRKLKEDLTELDAQYQKLASRLSGSGHTLSFAVLSTSFGSWQKAYGFGIYPVMMSRYGVLPDEEQIQMIEERIRHDGVEYIAMENNLNEAEEAVMNRVRNDCGLRKIDLSSLSSLSEEENENGRDYLSMMYQNLSVLNSTVNE